MFPLLSMEQSNPGLWGAQRVTDIFNKILENQKLGIQDRYLPDTLGAELAKKQEEAQLYRPNIETEMNLRNKQAMAAAAHAGLLGEQKRKTKNEADNPLLGATGTAGQIGMALYLLNHPELAAKIQQQNIAQQEAGIETPGQNIQQNESSYGEAGFNPEQQLSTTMKNIGGTQQQSAPMQRN